MSGRRLGRLFGSLLVLAALALTGLNVGLYDGITGDFQTADIIWTAGTGSSAVDTGR